jgi:hypothetical protein
MNNIIFKNSTLPGKNVTYQSLESWLTRIGSSWTQEIIQMTLLPVGLIGFILNMVALVVLNGKDFKMNVYSYIRFYSVSSGAICLITALRFVSKSYRFFSISNTFEAQMYDAIFYVPVSNVFYFYGSCLDIILTVDRIAMFTNKFRWFKELKPKKFCCLLFIFCAIMTTNFWLIRVVTRKNLQLSKNEEYILYFGSQSKNSKLAAVLTTNVIFDIIPIIIEVPLSVLTVILLKKYISKKKVMTTNVETTLANGTETTFQGQHKVKKENKKTKQMEVRVTVLIISMSFLSFM